MIGALRSIWPWGRGSNVGIGIFDGTSKRITLEDAMSIPAYLRASRLIATTVGRVPCDVYRTAENGREKDRGNPVQRLIRWQPNSNSGAYLFRQAMMAQAISYGNAYAMIMRDPTTRRPYELIPMRPDGIRVAYGDDKRLIYMHANDTNRRIAPEDILHIRGFTMDGVTGVDLLSYAAVALQLAYYSQQSTTAYARAGGVPGSTLTVPTNTKPEVIQRLRQGVQQFNSGNRIGTTMVLEGGVQFTPVSPPAREAALLEMRQQSVRDVACIMGVPAYKLGDSAAISYASVEAQSLDFLGDMDPWFVQWEQECNSKLLSLDERENGVYVEFNRDALVNIDAKAKSEIWARGLAGGAYLTVDEVRRMNNLPVGAENEPRQPSNLFGLPQQETTR